MEFNHCRRYIGLSKQDIAKLFGVTTRTINIWIKYRAPVHATRFLQFLIAAFDEFAPIASPNLNLSICSHLKEMLMIFSILVVDCPQS